MDLLSWNQWHPGAWAFLLMVQGLYLLGVEPLRKEFSWADRFDRKKAVWFSLGLLVVGLAEGTPLHGLSEQYLFSAHMTQHILILLIAPPLLLLGTPEWLLRPVTTLRWVSPVVRVVTKPVVAGVQFNAVLALWHIPAVYDAALGNHVLHYTQHFVFVFSAVLMWWPVVSPLPEHPSLHYAGQLLYLFVVNLPQKLLAVFLTLVSRPVYPTYAHADRILPISAIHDQQLGGAIMWAPMAMIFFAAFAIVFFVWFNKAEREDQAQREAGYR